MTQDLIGRVRAVVAPEPVLSAGKEHSLTARQTEILDQLSRLFAKGFAEITMAEIAAQVNCSLSSLYGLAPSRDQLVLMVVDRNLRKIGRAAHAAIRPEMSALDAVRAYLSAATVAVSSISEEFASDMAGITTGSNLNRSHSNYLVDVTRCLLDIAVGQNEIADVDTAAVARMIAGLGHDFARPAVLGQLRTSPKEAADAMVDVVLAGLRSSK